MFKVQKQVSYGCGWETVAGFADSRDAAEYMKMKKEEAATIVADDDDGLEINYRIIEE